jgi:hypothetical protein
MGHHSCLRSDGNVSFETGRGNPGLNGDGHERLRIA